MAYNFESQSKGLRALVLSPNRQGSWGPASVLPDAALTRIQRFDGSAVIDMSPTRRSDAAMSGKNTPFATNGQIIAWDLKVSGVKCELSDWIAVYVLSFLLGGYTVAKVTPASYTHFCVFDTSTRQAIPTTVYMQDIDGLSYKVPDMCITSATFTIGASGAVMLEFDFVGTGFLLPYAMVLPALPAETYIMASDAVAAFSGTNLTPNLIGRHLNSTIKLDNQDSVHRAPGGGLYGLFVRKGKPKFSISATIAATANDGLFTQMLNNTAVPFSIAVVSSPTSALFLTMPSSNLKTTKMGFDGDEIVWNIEMDETTIYVQSASQAPLTMWVNSSAPAFLTAGS